MLTAENIIEFTWKKAFPSPESLETIERVIRVLDYREEEGINALYRHALDDAESEGEGDDFPDILRWLALQRSIDFVDYGDVAFGDLRPFEVFTHARTLHMPVTLDADLAPLGKLTPLRRLSVVGAKDGDYGFLGLLPELKSLHISGLGGCGLEASSGLLKLKKLSLKGISIDLDQVIHEGIEELTLDGCGVTSLVALE